MRFCSSRDGFLVRLHTFRVDPAPFRLFSIVFVRFRRFILRVGITAVKIAIALVFLLVRKPIEIAIAFILSAVVNGFRIITFSGLLVASAPTVITQCGPAYKRTRVRQ